MKSTQKRPFTHRSSQKIGPSNVNLIQAKKFHEETNSLISDGSGEFWVDTVTNNK